MQIKFWSEEEARAFSEKIASTYNVAKSGGINPVYVYNIYQIIKIALLRSHCAKRIQRNESNSEIILKYIYALTYNKNNFVLTALNDLKGDLLNHSFIHWSQAAAHLTPLRYVSMWVCVHSLFLTYSALIYFIRHIFTLLPQKLSLLSSLHKTIDFSTRFASVNKSRAKGRHTHANTCMNHKQTTKLLFT